MDKPIFMLTSVDRYLLKFDTDLECLDYKLEGWTIGGSLHAEEKCYTDVLNTEKLAGFAIEDVRIA